MISRLITIAFVLSLGMALSGGIAGPSAHSQETTDATKTKSRIKPIVIPKAGRSALGGTLAPIFAEDATPEPPVRIKRIILHEEGKPARAIKVPARDLTGNWTIAEDSKGGRVPIKDRQLRMKSGGDGSLIAEFVKGADCPTGSGRRAHYIKGNLSGNSLSGTIELCPSAAFITKCGDESVYTTRFQAEVRDANTIAGRYTATGYRIEADGCVKDSYYESKETFLLKRQDIGTQATALQADPPPECAPSPQVEERMVPGGGETPTDSELSGDPVNLNAYCLAKHGEGAEALLLNKQDAYSWKCIGGTPTALHTIDVDKACMMQNPFSTAELGNRCDPYSWSCSKLVPRKLVYVRLDAIELIPAFHTTVLEGQGEVTFYFTARHASPRCSGPEYGAGNRTCGEWEYKKSVKINTDDFGIPNPFRIEINNWVFPFYLYDGSSLQIDFWAIEKDPFVDDECGLTSGSAVIIPVRETFTESDNWGIGGRTIGCRGKGHGNYFGNPYGPFDGSDDPDAYYNPAIPASTAYYTILDMPQ